ncbi:hypothetical protein C0995_010663, partial [Termitomyces sp. Mi166
MLDSGVQTVVTSTTIFLVGLWVSRYLLRFNSIDRRLPPGPSGLPVLGNLLQVPGKTVILLGDMKIAKELLEKHSAKHSSRPVLPYVRKHVDPETYIWVLSDECESHRIGRKLTVGIMSLVRAGKTDLLHEYEAALNIQHLLNEGDKDWFHQIKRVASSTILTAVFGMHCPTGYEPELRTFLDLSWHADTNPVQDLAEATYLATPTASITNFLPFLDLIPGPMPWRTRAESYRKKRDASYEKLVNDAVTGKASGMNTWAAFFAKEDKPEGDQRRLVRQFAGTTVALLTFVLACICYPDWIATAQREIDNVVGTDRLPTFKDRPFLPYVEAIVR